MTGVPLCECLGLGTQFFWVSTSPAAVNGKSTQPLRISPLESFHEAHSIALRLRASYPSQNWEIGCADYDQARLSLPDIAVLHRRARALALRLLLGREQGFNPFIEALRPRTQEVS